MIHLASPSSLQNGAGSTTAPSAPAPGPAQPAAPSLFQGMWVPLLLCAVVFYLLVLGPERKQRKKRDEMLNKLSKGDKVMTTGGLYASVVAVQDDVVTLQIADGVRARFARSAVQSVVAEEGAAEKAPEREPEKVGAKK
jgi:preprotein translocase subunit YajC